MRKLFPAFIASVLILSCEDKKEPSPSEPLVKSSTEETPAQSEFADSKYMEWGKQRLVQFENGDIDTWGSQFSENAVYQWSAGDSVAGKDDIIKYWKERRKNVIETIKFTNDIWLPIKVNQSQKGPDLPGNWLLSWYQVDVTYKTKKSLTYWVHTDIHYNERDQVDRVIQYIDRAPINAALHTK